MSIKTETFLGTPFANNAGSTGRFEITNTNETDYPQKATFEEGFPAVTRISTSAGGKNPFGQDFNGIFYQVTSAIRELQAGKTLTYNEDFANAIGGYTLGAKVTGSDGLIYICTTDGNTSDPTGLDGWQTFLSSATDSESETQAATSLAVKQAYDLAKSVSDKFLIIGDFKLFPFRKDNLPSGWYFRNGDNYLLSSKQGQILNGFSEDYKSDHGITIKNMDGLDYINVPDAFSSSGYGYFERPVDGVSRQVGSIQSDAIVNIKGNAGVSFDSSRGSGVSGVFKSTYTSGSVDSAGENGDYKGYSVSMDISREWATADENRPINYGLTPAIYLGV